MNCKQSNTTLYYKVDQNPIKINRHDKRTRCSHSEFKRNLEINYLKKKNHCRDVSIIYDRPSTTQLAKVICNVDR